MRQTPPMDPMDPMNPMAEKVHPVHRVHRVHKKADESPKDAGAITYAPRTYPPRQGHKQRSILTQFLKASRKTPRMCYLYPISL